MPRWLAFLIPVALILAAAGAQTRNAHSVASTPTAPNAPALTPTLTIDGLGKGSAELGGPWQFHVGDDMRWAQPGIDDATGHNGWETIRVDQPWGMQTHFSYAGFAWYRRHLTITPAPGIKPDFRLLMPPVVNACEIYWNGALIGRIGKLPPHPSWPATGSSRIFPFPGAGSGTLAIRVWAAPLGSSDPGTSGGLTDKPLLGDAASIAGVKAIHDDVNFRANLYGNAQILIAFLLGCGAFLVWLRRRQERVYLWFAIFAVSPAIWSELFNPRRGLSEIVASSILQPLFALGTLAVWYLLIHLLELRSRRRLVAWTNVLAIVYLTASTLDGVLAYFQALWGLHAWMPAADAALTGFGIIGSVLPLVLVAFGIRQKLNPARWAVALTAFIADMLTVLVAASQEGQRFTHWNLTFLAYPFVWIGGVYLSVQMLAATAFIIAILSAIYRYAREHQARQRDLEEELRSARELQRVLIPEDPPAVPGFTLTSAYRPARDVGGDFFQVVPLAGGSTLIVLGDVSGKGLRAAMAVSLIVGAARALADDYPHPAALLTQLNRRLCGRLQGGFATCIAVRIGLQGECRVASAGHPAPYLNDRELPLPGALPLGINPDTSYEEFAAPLKVGDHLALYTDGLLEARSQTGELFSFERLKNLFAATPDAARAAEAAMDFGQEDDITVLTLQRLAAGEESRVAFRTHSA